jgi:hypothetical protein
MGESMRALVLARGAAQRWPEARIEIVMDAPASWLEGRGFAHHVVEGGPSRNAEGMNELLRRIRPDIAIFDGRGRTATLALAVALGARTVFIAANERSLQRIFGSRRLGFLDQLWIVQGRFGTAGLLTLRRRLRLALARRSQVHVFDALFPEPEPGRGRELRRRIGLAEEPYALFCAGGGGTEHAGRPVSEIFAEAAGRAREATGLATVTVLGPLYAGEELCPPGVIVLESLEPDAMIDLLANAEVVACGGGDLTAQALTNRRPCVVAPTEGLDQPQAVRALEKEGLIEASPLGARELADRAIRLLRDADRRDSLCKRVEARGLRNGLTEALDRLGDLIASKAAA